MLPVAVVISGRGSNMEAIARTAQAQDSGFRVVRGDRRSAGRRRPGARRGARRADLRRPRQGICRPRRFRGGIERRARCQRLLARGPGRIHAHPVAGIRAAFRGKTAEHPPFTAAPLQGPRHPCARAGGPRLASRRQRALRAAELDGGPVVMQGRLRVRAGDTPESISARVHALEHIIYPHVCSLIARRRIEWHHGSVYFDGAPLTTPIIEENDAAA